MKFFYRFRSLLGQSFITYMLVIFLALVLFNTTYLSLGTFVPLIVIFVTLTYLMICGYGINKDFSSMFLYVLLLLPITMLSGGDEFREILKILLTLLFASYITSVRFTNKEVHFISFMLCIVYSIYAILVINSLGLETEYFGRAQISILNSNIPLDPNVTAAAFVLPIAICFYNTLYGKVKVLSASLLGLFFVAIVLLGSRGAFASISVVIAILFIHYLFKSKQSFIIKLIMISSLIVFSVYLLFYLSTAEDIKGLDRILGDSDDLQGGNGRIAIWQERLDLLIYSPIFGYGCNYNLGKLAGTATHNTILQIIYYGGLVGAILFFIPIIKLYIRPTVNRWIKIALFISVFLPIFFIDTLQERTLWNFLIFYEILSCRNNATDCLIWFK